MEPRLKSSVKWTQLPPDITAQIRDLFKQNFQKELANAEIVVDGRIYKQEILLRVGYLEKGRLVQNNFEISMEYKLTQQDSALNTLYICVDAAAALMADHFESDGTLELPYSWAEYPFEGKKVWLQFSTTNTQLEKQANELLGEWNEGLVQGEVEEAEDVGEESDDDIEDEEIEIEAEEEQEFEEDDDQDLDDDDDDDDDPDDDSNRRLH